MIEAANLGEVPNTLQNRQVEDMYGPIDLQALLSRITRPHYAVFNRNLRAGNEQRR
jgi:hypothetical protein